MFDQKKVKIQSENYLVSKDYTVSNETFDIIYNKEYDLLITSPAPDNLDKYYISESYISHTDSNKGLFNKTYQIIKKYALNKKLKLINNQLTTDKSILDIGAGTGDFLNVCKLSGWKVTGIEPSFQARNLANEKGITLHENIENIKNKKFDVITLWHVLEHIPNLEEQIKIFKNHLNKNGTLIIAVPNYKSYDAKYYGKHWAAFDVPRHLWHFSTNSIKKIFNEINMDVVKTLPMKFDSYYVSLLSEKYKTGKMNPLKAFQIGFISNLKAKKENNYSSLIYLLKNSKN
ncbi:Methyltransferase domain-containing protein [Tenacibaculum sp. 190524A02b]|uniref:Methyltransferase domain-containing protein n=1 Tax=Tenacibaculum vairaonense TaxID=3137860 RepID=A0ABP1FI50_9FLAO